MLHLWHNLSSGVEAPDVVYRWSKCPKAIATNTNTAKRRAFKLDRVLFNTALSRRLRLHPQTYFDDNDPMDILVMINEPTFPGCVIEAPHWHVKLIDRAVDYAVFPKILAPTDPNFEDYAVFPPRHRRFAAAFSQRGHALLHGL
jgi:inorganic pyrophosphatase